MVEFGINSSMNKSTGYTPFDLVFGYMPTQTLTALILRQFVWDTSCSTAIL